MSRIIRQGVFLCCAGLLLASAGEGQTIFADATKQVPAPLFRNIRSTAFGDYDSDGRPDILLAIQTPGNLALLHNEDDGRFADRSAAIQAEFPNTLYGGGAVFGDYDNDGDLDLFVPIGSFFADNRSLNLLLRNDRGVFTDVAGEVGLTDVQSTDNAIWLDYDRDGHLDLYTGNVGDAAFRNKLYRNRGDATFEDATEAAGLNIQFNPEGGGSNGGFLASDFDDDGWPDLYMGIYDVPNRLFLNDGQGGFRDASTGEIADPGEAFGTAVGDIDNNGLQDIFQAACNCRGEFRSVLLQNLGSGLFLDILEGAGLSVFVSNSPLAAGLADMDNDGDIDLITGRPHYLFLNNGDPAFVDRTSDSGIDDAGLAVSFGDFDLDGFLDVFFGSHGDEPNLLLYRNNGNDNHWLRVELVGVQSNRNGIGTRLVATAGELRQVREILGGLGYYQDEMVAHFGLGPRTQVDELQIRWPSGQVDVLTDIPTDQKIRVFEGRPGYHFVRPTVWERVNLPDTLVAGATIDLSVALRPALFAPDARIASAMADLSDLGGPEGLPLADNDDGTWQLDAEFVADVPNGLHSFEVMIDQETFMGPHWVQMSRQIAVLPETDLSLLGEAGWQVETSNGAESPDFAAADPVDASRKTTALQVEPGSFLGWNVVLQPASPVDLFGYSHLRLAFHPGAVEGRSFSLIVGGERGSRNLPLVGRQAQEGRSVDLAWADWQVVEIPLAELDLAGPITSITFNGDLEGTFYIGDLRLVAGPPPPSTAVEEEAVASLPSAFALSQNYPNPFNSGTVIHFALPVGEHVDLSLYNLAGQRIVTLVTGRREAGAYTARWDGRDEAGRELASGVYLYRLQSDAQVETRKLLLVR